MCTKKCTKTVSNPRNGGGEGEWGGGDKKLIITACHPITGPTRPHLPAARENVCHFGFLTIHESDAFLNRGIPFGGFNTEYILENIYVI